MTHRQARYWQNRISGILPVAEWVVIVLSDEEEIDGGQGYYIEIRSIKYLASKHLFHRFQCSAYVHLVLMEG